MTELPAGASRSRPGTGTALARSGPWVARIARGRSATGPAGGCEWRSWTRESRARARRWATGWSRPSPWSGEGMTGSSCPPRPPTSWATGRRVRAVISTAWCRRRISCRCASWGRTTAATGVPSPRACCGPSSRRGHRWSTSRCPRAAMRSSARSTSLRTRPTSGTSCWSQLQTMCPWRATPRSTRPSCPWRLTTSRTLPRGSTTPPRPWSSGRIGLNVDVAWRGGTRMSVTGNSFAAPHMAGYAARIRAAHPGIAPFEVKAVLAATADNAR